MLLNYICYSRCTHTSLLVSSLLYWFVVHVNILANILIQINYNMVRITASQIHQFALYLIFYLLKLLSIYLSSYQCNIPNTSQSPNKYKLFKSTPTIPLIPSLYPYNIYLAFMTHLPLPWYPSLNAGSIHPQ